MRRALASFLLAVFSFPLIVPAMLGDAESNLPECCRRGGKHHCAMMMDEAPVTGLSFRSAHARCPLYPGITATRAGEYVAVLNRSGVIFGARVSHPAIHLPTQAIYSGSFSRTRQKRGPPILS